MIEIKELTKVYRDTTAVDAVNLEIKEGEVFAFLGPNGAGKTTVILMLSTLLEPTSGTGIVNGHDVLKEPHLVKRDVGILFQDTSLDDRLTGYENLEIQAVLYDVPKNKRNVRVDEMLDFVGLAEWARVPVERYSGGMRRRLEIARCLMHRPKVLLLDEPTLGLDPNAREVIWRHIKGLRDMTIVITTNYIEEAEMLSDRIAIIDSGRVVALGSPEELKSSLKMDLGHITTKAPEKLKSALAALPYVGNIKIDGSKIVFTIKEGKRKDLLDTMASYDLDSIEVRRPSLSDVFLQHTGKSIDVPMERPARRRGLGRRRR
ncbi:MAG: ATP-binding cassette domain-containing protein [Candidatus Hydrothermarchaeales archaeon]